MRRSVASDLILYCFSMSHKMEAGFIWAKSLTVPVLLYILCTINLAIVLYG